MGLPSDWLDQLKAVYPKRSGPMRWPRVFLPVRRALMETTWDDLISGVKRYAEYCKASGKEGSEFVATPESFFKDEIYLEELLYQPSKTKEESRAAEIVARDAERIANAVRDSGGLLRPMRGECAAAFETRIALERTRGPSCAPHRPSAEPMGTTAIRDPVVGLHDRIAHLTDRMRIAK